MQKAYIKGMTDPQMGSDRLGLMLLGIGAATAGLALTGTTGAPLVAGALVTATGVTGGQLFLQPQARKEIFKAGATACGCVRDATDHLPSVETQLAAMKLEALRAELGTFHQQMVALEAVLAEATNVQIGGTLYVAATRALERSKELKKRADQLYDEAKRLQKSVHDASGSIYNNLEKIRTAVTAAALSTAPDLTTLHSSLRSIQFDATETISGFLAPGTEDALGKAKQAQRDAEGAARDAAPSVPSEALPRPLPWPYRLRQALDDLGKAILSVENHLDQVNRDLRTITVGDISASIRACVTAAQNIPDFTPLRFTPASAFNNLRPGDTVKVVVSGGSGSFTAEELWDAKIDIQVTKTTGAKTLQLEIRVGTGVPSGHYHLLVRDTSPRPQSETIKLAVSMPIPLVTVPAAPQKVAAGGNVTFTLSGGVPPYTSLGPISDAVSPAALEVTPIGPVDLKEPTVSVTVRAATRAGTYRALVKDSVGRELTLEIVVEAPAPASPSGDAPPRVTGAAVIRRAQVALRDLGHAPGPVDGILGPLTRAALINFQRENRLPQSGTLDAATARVLRVSDE